MFTSRGGVSKFQLKDNRSHRADAGRRSFSTTLQSALTENRAAKAVYNVYTYMNSTCNT